MCLNPTCSLHGFSLECFPLHSLPPSLSPSLHAVGVLLAVLRVLLNLTHDNELGSHRLGEQEGAVKTVLDIIFLVLSTTYVSLLTQCWFQMLINVACCTNIYSLLLLHRVDTSHFLKLFRCILSLFQQFSFSWLMVKLNTTLTNEFGDWLSICTNFHCNLFWQL